MRSITTRSTRRTTVAATALAAAAVLGGTAYATSSASSAVVAGSASAAAAPHVNLRLQTSTPALDACFPHARAKVRVDLTTDDIGFDTFTIKAKGLQPDTAFTVFLIEKAGLPFGHVEYIGDIFTDQYGSARNTFELIVEEAFAFDNETGDRADLNSVGFWFADEKDDDDCLGAGSPVTGFDGDGKAGVQMMNSGTRLLP